MKEHCDVHNIDYDTDKYCGKCMKEEIKSLYNSLIKYVKAGLTDNDIMSKDEFFGYKPDTLEKYIDRVRKKYS